MFEDKLSQLARILVQALGFLLLSRGLSGATTSNVDFGHSAVRLGVLRAECRRFLQIGECIRILSGALTFLCECEGGGVEKIGGCGILRI